MIMRTTTYFYNALKDKGFSSNEAKQLSKELHSKYVEKEKILVDTLLKFAWLREYSTQSN
tara:strand:+ start:211 stop:390 length:180 start_codon:yes stop_codon:yes gene_type:complete